jgi:hypothetical protein
MILLWGVPGDHPMAAVRWALARLGTCAVFVNQHELLDTEIELHVGDVGERIQGRLKTPHEEVDLEQVEAVYLRPYDITRLPVMTGVRAGTEAWARGIAVDDTLTSWADLTPAFTVNRPSAMAANASKPFQAAWIERFGFKTPQCLVTTDAERVRDFRGNYPDVIYKSISGTRSIVARLTDMDDERIDDVEWCPTQFQEYVEGRDVRVHVVGNEIFACRVTSDADDYRYAGQQGFDVTLEPCRLSAELTERCLAMSDEMGLYVSGIDLRETADGDWYCLEVNPSPGFTYFASGTGQPIAYAVAHLISMAQPPAGWSHTEGSVGASGVAIRG